MMKRIFALLLTAWLLLSMTACGSALTDAVGEAAQDAQQEVQQPEDNQDEAAAAVPSVEMGDELSDFTVSINGTVLRFPCTLADVQAAGWEADSGAVSRGVYTNPEEPGRERTLVTFYYKGDENQNVDFIFSNVSDTAMPRNECPIVGVYNNGAEGVEWILPGNFEVVKGVTTKEDVIAQYGGSGVAYIFGEDRYFEFFAYTEVYNFMQCINMPDTFDGGTQEPTEDPEQSEEQVQTETEAELETAPSEQVILQSKKGNLTGIYEYDENGRNVKITYYADGETAYDRYKIFEYDDAGQVIEWRVYTMHDELWDRHTYAYDEAGNKTEDIRYYSDGTPYERYTYEYNEAGKLFREIRYYYIDEAYDVLTVWEYQYDENGVLIKVLTLSDDLSKVRYYENYFYDENGHLDRTENRDINDDRLMYFREITCNERGEMIRDEWYMAGDTEPREVDEYSYTYDENNRLIEENGTTYEYGPMPG